MEKLFMNLTDGEKLKYYEKKYKKIGDRLDNLYNLKLTIKSFIKTLNKRIEK